MNGLAGLILVEAQRTVDAAERGALLAPLPSSGAPALLDGPGGLLAACGDTVTVGRHPGGWAVADHDVTGIDGEAALESGARAAERLVDLVARHGAEAPDRLRGAFALAVWDPRARRLTLAVDRFGFRRLYYAVTARGIAFGSRPACAMAVPGMRRAADLNAAYAYLSFGTVPAPQTMYRDVRRLPAGHVLVWQDGRITTERYWDMRYDAVAAPRPGVAGALAAHAEAAVREALAGLETKQTGAFLSGGTDSSTILGLATRISGEKVSAFSIGFAEERYNELAYAELAARHFDASHSVKVVGADEALAAVPAIVDAYDEPFGNNSVIPTYLCARLARDSGMSTMLAGDGGDEIFGGNERYRREQVFARYQLLPRPVRTMLLEPVLRRVPPGHRGLLGKAQRYVERASTPNPGRFYASEFFFAGECRRMLHPDFLAAIDSDFPWRVAREHYLAAPASAELHRLMYIDLKITLADNDLYKVTRSAEAAGIGVRFPFLDRRLVEFTGTLPARDKVRGTEKRHLFRQAFASLLPAEIMAKTKHGFGLPVSDWIRYHRGFRELVRDTLLSRRALERPYFAERAVAELFDLHAGDSTPYYGDLLWTLYMLEAWHRRHGDAA